MILIWCACNLLAVPTNHLSEELLSDLMRRTQAGDASAYRELLNKMRVIIMSYSNRVLGRMGIEDPSVADDLTQDVLLAIHQKRHTYDPAQLFTPWMFAIARYKVIDEGRRRKRQPGFCDLAVHQDLLKAPDTAEPLARDDLDILLATLSPRARQSLELVKLEGLSTREAAKKMHSTESALKVTVHRALKSLRALTGRGNHE